MRTPILGIFIPFLVFSILFENQTFEQSTIIYLQILYFIILIGYYNYYKKHTNLIKIAINVGSFVILSIYLHLNYRNLMEQEKVNKCNFPHRELILDIKIKQKVKTTKFNEKYEKKYFGTVEKVPKFAKRIMHRDILCSIDNKLDLSLKGKIIQVKGIVSFNNKDWLNIKRCNLISIKTTNVYSNIISDIRSYITKNFEELDITENKISGFLNAVFLGNKEMLSQKEKESYQYSGTMHLFAVSGLHVGFLYLIFKFIFSSFCKNHIVSELLIMLMILIYLELIYYPPSAMRATIMLFVWQCTAIFSKKRNVFSSLFLSCLLLLIINPSYVVSIGFQLSYTVVFSILVYSKVSSQFNYDRFNFGGSFLIGSFIKSFSAFCGSILLVYDYFSLIVPISIFINLLAVPIAFLFVLTSFIMLILQIFIGTEIFSSIFYFLYWFLEVIINLCNIENITYFKISENKNISNIVHFIYPFSFIIFFFSDKGFIFKSFLFILIPFLFIFLFSFFI